MGKSTWSKAGEDIARLRGQRWTAAEAVGVVSAWETSGLSMAAFARRHRLTAQRIAWWRDRLGKLSSAVPAGQVANAPLRFVPAVLRESPAGSGSAGVTIRVRGGVEVEIADPTQISPQWLATLIRQCGEATP